jgi:hypothetical protein
MTVIVIDSDLGSDGDVIAATVAARLGLSLVDEAFLFERLRSRGVNLPTAIPCRNREGVVANGGYPWRSLGTKLHLELLRLAQQDQILLHWSCASYLLAEVGHVPRIKVRAPLSMRVRRHAARCGCDEREARRRIQQHEGKTRFIFSACFGVHAPLDAECYSLVADTGWLASVDWADEIIEMARDAEFSPTVASQAMLRWQLLQLPQEPDEPVACDCDASRSC